MRKWVKRSILGLLLAITLVVALAYWLFRGTPDWYRPAQLSPAERTAAAERAEGKVRATYNFAAKLQADEQKQIYAAKHGSNPSTASTRPRNAAAESPNAFTVAFTEDELNAFFEKWSTHYNWAAAYGQYLSNPTVVLRDGKLIIAGTLAELGTVTSAHFRPAVVAGKFSLQLQNVYAGRLPMPDAVYAKQRDRLLGSIREKLPAWQRAAQIAPNGTANPAAVSAGMSKLLLSVMNERPGEPVLYLPVEGGAVPVRITHATIANRELTLTVEPMTAGERSALLARIRAPEDGAGVTASGR